MSDEGSFLARWSRRKRRAATKAHDEAKPESAAGSVPAAQAPPVFDAASLPPIESIGAGTDIQAFLAAGVPVALSRAALRRAWTADPTIRDFIGLAENSWDFNAGEVAGFGSVKPEDARRLLARLMAEPEAAAPTHPNAAALSGEQTSPPASESGPAAQDSAPAQIDQGVAPNRNDRDLATRPEATATAMQHGAGDQECRSPMPQRRHGSALPK